MPLGNKTMTYYALAYDSPHHRDHRDAKRIARDLLTGTTVKGGVIRWNSNNRVPPAECVQLADHIGIMVDFAACDAARSQEVSDFLSAYRANPPVPTAEDFAEMRSAFGPGATAVNVVTGQKWEL